VEYAPESPGAQDYNALADWLTNNSLNKSGASCVGAEEARSLSGHALAEEAGRARQTPATPPINRAADLAQRARRLTGRPADAEVVVNSEPPTAPAGASMVELKVVEEVPARPMPDAAMRESIETIDHPSKNERQAIAPSDLTHLAPTPAVAATNSPWPTMGYGPQVTPHGVIFRLPASIGRAVAVAGDFNQWMPERTPMRLSEQTGTLEAVAFMPPGSTSQYRLVIDGNWIADPYNPSIVPNPFGGSNSVVSVPVMMGAEVVIGLGARAGERV
jgi:hypothetical protein